MNYNKDQKMFHLDDITVEGIFTHTKYPLLHMILKLNLLLKTWHWILKVHPVIGLTDIKLSHQIWTIYSYI